MPQADLGRRHANQRVIVRVGGWYQLPVRSVHERSLATSRGGLLMTPAERRQDQDFGHTVAHGQSEGQGEELKGLRSYWRAVPRIWKVLGAVLTPIAAIFAIIVPLGVISPSPSPAQPTGYFQGFVMGQIGLHVRQTPKRSGSVVASLQPGTTVFIVCTKKGDPVKGPGHSGGTITTRVWDYVRTATSAGPLGFVPDAWVNTGTVKPEAHDC